MHNVDKYYLVVGLQESLKELMSIVVAILPQFFVKESVGNLKKGVTFLQKPNNFIRTGLPKTNHGSYKHINNITRSILKVNLSLEYEFYNFVKQRLELLKVCFKNLPVSNEN